MGQEPQLLATSALGNEDEAGHGHGAGVGGAPTAGEEPVKAEMVRPAVR